MGPDYVLLENVSALLTRGLDAVLGTLASLGYDGVWACVPACAVGAPHRRDRVWIVAIPESPGSKQRLEVMYTHVLSRLTPFSDLREGWPTATTWSTPRSEGYDAGGGRKHSSLMQETTWTTMTVNDAYHWKRDSDKFTSLVRDARASVPNPQNGSLNPDWVETLMGYPIGYTLPEGEPLLYLPREWPSDSPDGRGWMTPKQGDGVFASGSTSGRSREMSTHLPTQVKLTQGWPAGLGAPQHEWEPPRLTTDRQHRMSRLKALGNSIVPQVALLWMEAIQRDAPVTGESI